MSISQARSRLLLSSHPSSLGLTPLHPMALWQMMIIRVVFLTPDFKWSSTSRILPWLPISSMITFAFISFAVDCLTVMERPTMFFTNSSEDLGCLFTPTLLHFQLSEKETITCLQSMSKIWLVSSNTYLPIRLSTLRNSTSSRLTSARPQPSGRLFKLYPPVLVVGPFSKSLLLT